MAGNLDDVPVQGIGNKLTFEELLERELAAAGNTASNPTKSSPPRRKPFLEKKKTPVWQGPTPSQRPPRDVADRQTSHTTRKESPIAFSSPSEDESLNGSLSPEPQRKGIEYPDAQDFLDAAADSGEEEKVAVQPLRGFRGIEAENEWTPPPLSPIGPSGSEKRLQRYHERQRRESAEIDEFQTLEAQTVQETKRPESKEPIHEVSALGKSWGGEDIPTHDQQVHEEKEEEEWKDEESWDDEEDDWGQLTPRRNVKPYEREDVVPEYNQRERYEQVFRAEPRTTQDVYEDEDDEPVVPTASQPPPSALIQRLFHASAEKKKKPQPKSVPPQQQQKVDPSPSVTEAALQEEMVKFKRETENLRKQRKAKEHEVAMLQRERQRLEQHRAKDEEEVREMQEKALKKIRKERKLLERHIQASKEAKGPVKKEQERMDMLEKKLEKYKSDARARETKLKQENDRLRRRVETLMEQHRDQEEQIQAYEARRLEEWELRTQLEEEIRELQSVPRVAKRATLAQGKGTLAQGKVFRHAVSPKVAATIARALQDEESEEQLLDDMENDELAETPPSPGGIDVSEQALSERTSQDGKIERVYSNGRRVVTFPNGTLKEMCADGSSCVVFANGDIKRTHQDGRIVYSYGEAGTVQTSYPNGMEVFHFSNGQAERHFQDGMREIRFPDGTVKFIQPNGDEETVFGDGTVQRIGRDGVCEVEFVDGQKEVRSQDGSRRRHYPGGVITTTRMDGSKETMFPSGRVRKQ